jgi:hypothetical protein
LRVQLPAAVVITFVSSGEDDVVTRATDARAGSVC